MDTNHTGGSYQSQNQLLSEISKHTLLLRRYGKTCIGTKRPMHDNFMKKQRVTLRNEELGSRHGCMGRNVTAPSTEMNARPWFWPHENGTPEKTIKKGGLRLL